MRKLQHSHERWLFTIKIPDGLVDKLGQLPKKWDAEPASAATQQAGDQWIATQRSVALLVPSAIVPVEMNALINPRHPQFRLEWVAKPVRFRYDPRLK